MQREALLRAFRAVEDPKAQGFADLEAVATELRVLHERAGSLPAGKRERTRFFIAVREAEVRLRQGRLEEAGRLGLAARAQAQADQVYGGGYRAQLLVLLEQCLDVGFTLQLAIAQSEVKAHHQRLLPFAEHSIEELVRRLLGLL